MTLFECRKSLKIEFFLFLLFFSWPKVKAHNASKYLTRKMFALGMAHIVGNFVQKIAQIPIAFLAHNVQAYLVLFALYERIMQTKI